MKKQKPIFVLLGGSNKYFTDQIMDQSLWWGYFKSALKNKHYHLAWSYFWTWFSLV